MIKKIAAIAVVTITIFSTHIAKAGDGWQISILASVHNAENRIIIGQMPDASDDIDGRYDIPALLAGDIKAYVEHKDRYYWKDMKNSCEISCKKIWMIICLKI